MKNIVLFSVSMAFALSTVGCLSWVEKTQSNENIIYGIGIAEIGEPTANGRISTQNQAQQLASARARDDISRQLSASVEGMITDYFGNNIASSEAVSRQLNKDILERSMIDRRSFKKGAYYVRAGYKTSYAKDIVRDAAKDAQINAAAALQRMDEAFRNF
jgi:hypothetical protein